MCRGAVLLLLFILPAPCRGQVSSTCGSLQVCVGDATGAQAPGPSIEVKMRERRWSRAFTADGEPLRMPALPPGDCTESISAGGVDPEQSVVAIKVRHHESVQFVLRPGARNEQITVTAAAEENDFCTIPVHARESDSEVQGLPTDQSNLLDFAPLARRLSATACWSMQSPPGLDSLAAFDQRLIRAGLHMRI